MKEDHSLNRERTPASNPEHTKRDFRINLRCRRRKTTPLGKKPFLNVENLAIGNSFWRLLPDEDSKTTSSDLKF